MLTHAAAGNTDTRARVVVEHWDGASWRVVP